MPPKGKMSTMLLRAARDARSAAAMASRAARTAAAAAVGGGDMALASRPPARRYPLKSRFSRGGGAQGAAARPSRTDDLDSRADRGRVFDYKYIDPQNPVAVKDQFVAEEKDMDSDEALWALYERWCKHFKQERSHDEMARHLDAFKNTVRRVHQVNSADLPYKLEICEYADGKLRDDEGIHPNSWAAGAPNYRGFSELVLVRGRSFLEEERKRS